MKNQKVITKMAVLLVVLRLGVTANASLVAHYKLDGDANDATGTYNGVAYSSDGIVDWKPTESKDPAVLGGSLYFAGGADPDRVNCGDVPVSRAATTVAYWAKARYLANCEPINKFPSDGSGVGFRVGFRSNGKVRLWTGSQTANTENVGEADTGVCYAVDQWVHHAWVFDNSTIRFYVDGMLRCTKTATREISAPGTDLLLGRIGYTTSYSYRGNLDDVRIYNHALTAEEIRTLLGSVINFPPEITLSATGIIIQPGVETALPTVTVDDEDFAGNPLSAVTWSAAEKPEGSTVTFDATATDTVTVSHDGNYRLEASVNDGQYTNTVSLLVVGRSPGGALRNQWKFENNLTDSVGGIEGQATESAYAMGFKPNSQAVDFDGSTGRVVDCGPLAAATTGDLTYAVWLKPTSLGNRQAFVKSSTEDGFKGFQLSLRSDSTIRFIVGNSSSAIYALAPEGSYTNGTWVHLACTMDVANNLVTAYVNGLPVHSRTLAGRTPGVLESVDSLMLGAYASLSERYVGLMDDLQFYDKALSAKEIKEIVIGTGTLILLQ